MATPAPLPDTGEPRRVLIVGAGDLGLGLAARLDLDDHAVTTLNRSGRHADGVPFVVGDLADPASLTDLPAADIVVFTTAPPGRDADAYRLAYIDGPARILAALPDQPQRVVLTSTTGVYGIDDGSWVDVDSPTEPTRATAEVVVDGEQRLAALAPTCVVRPAGIYGPGRGALIESVRAGEAPIARDDTPRWTNRVHRDDVVAALAVAALHDDTPPVALAVDDEPSPRDEVILWLAERLGAPEPEQIDIASVSGKRCHNNALRSLGWTPAYPSYRTGYPTLL